MRKSKKIKFDSNQIKLIITHSANLVIVCNILSVCVCYIQHIILPLPQDDGLFEKQKESSSLSLSLSLLCK
jgi:hypothetical protein